MSDRPKELALTQALDLVEPLDTRELEECAWRRVTLLAIVALREARRAKADKTRLIALLMRLWADTQP